MSAPGPPDFLHALPIGVWVAKAPSGELAYVNGAFSEILGMGARDDVKAGGYSEPYGIYDREGNLYPEDRLPFARVIAQRTSVVVDDLVIHRGDGRRAYVRAFAKPLIGPDGDLTHVVIAFTDMTAEVTAKVEKEIVQDRLRTAVAHAPIVLFAYDREGRVTLVEGSPVARLKLRPEEMLGRPVYELYGNVPEIVSSARRVLEHGETVIHPVTVDDMAFETWLSPVRDATGAITGAIGVATEVTERARMQAKILQTDRMVSLGTLAAGVAHELNNPLAYLMESLAGIDDLLTLLHEDLDRSGQLAPVAKRMERLRQYAAHAREGAERLRVVTADLRSFSRVDDARHPVEVAEAVASALRLVSKTLEGRARLVTDFAPTPAVSANEARLAQVVVNLAVNAAQAIPAGASREHHEIRVSTRTEGDAVVIEVSDTGPGVPPEIRERLFDAFFTTKEKEGTGLGLFVSKKIVEAFGGSIEVDDRPGGGAAFRVRLPAASPAPPQARLAPRTSAGRAQVLVIEDDPTLGELMRGALLQECEVRVARSGEEGLQALAEKNWDLVLCDLHLGDMTAMEIHERLRTERPGRERSLVFMTGGAHTPAARRFLESVPNDRLEKPFDVRSEVRRRLAR